MKYAAIVLHCDFRFSEFILAKLLNLQKNLAIDWDLNVGFVRTFWKMPLVFLIEDRLCWNAALHDPYLRWYKVSMPMCVPGRIMDHYF